MILKFLFLLPVLVSAQQPAAPLSSTTHTSSSASGNGSTLASDLVNLFLVQSLLGQLFQCAGVDQSDSCSSKFYHDCSNQQCGCAISNAYMFTCFGDRQIASCSNGTSIRSQVQNAMTSICHSSGYAVDSSSQAQANSAGANSFISATLFSAWTLLTAAVAYAF